MEKDCGGSFQIGSPGYHKFAFDGGAGSSIFDWQLHSDCEERRALQTVDIETWDIVVV